MLRNRGEALQLQEVFTGSYTEGFSKALPLLEVPSWHRPPSSLGNAFLQHLPVRSSFFIKFSIASEAKFPQG